VFPRDTRGSMHSDAMLSAMGMGSSDDDDEYDEDDDVVSQLMRKVEEQDNQMRMAAEIGQALLEKNETLLEDIEESEAEQTRLEGLLEEMTYRNEELEDAIARMEESDVTQLEQIQSAHDNMEAQLAGEQAEVARLRLLGEETESALRSALRENQEAKEDRLSEMVSTPRGRNMMSPEKVEMESLREQAAERDEIARAQDESQKEDRAKHAAEVARLHRQLETAESSVGEMQKAMLAFETERGTLIEGAHHTRVHRAWICPGTALNASACHCVFSQPPGEVPHSSPACSYRWHRTQLWRTAWKRARKIPFKAWASHLGPALRMS
jgi:DNA repair exonuclease SbcCD ATPase subunit